MIDEIGHFALVLALCIAALQSVVPLIGAARNDAGLMAWARPAALAQFLFIGTAFFALMHAYAVSDFSLANVAANSNSMKPLVYKLSGVWSNHEGSMLLWVFILALFGAAVAVFSHNLPPQLRARCALTIGIAMGSWWAYYTLGWGGWWFWDPVENASFMPWLVGTALLHSAV